MLVDPVVRWPKGVVSRVRLALGERRSQAFLLQQRKRTKVLVNKAVVFDIIPYHAS
jgi:hypothetical protein